MFQLHLEVQTIHPEKGITSSKAWVSKSFVKTFLQILYRNMSKLSVVTIDLSGTNRNPWPYIPTSILNLPQQSGDGRVYAYRQDDEYFGDEVGILIGTGVAANTALTYTMHTQIEHGITAGKMEYMGGVINDVVVAGADSYFDIERIFRNRSGGSIVVKEYGISVLNGHGNYGIWPHLIARDYFTDSGDWVTVANTEYLKVTYRLLVMV